MIRSLVIPRLGGDDLEDRATRTESNTLNKLERLFFQF